MAFFLWHDYETFGSDPSRDFPCQFAAIRTDEDLNPVGKPINLICQIPNDYLPHPEACLITGITPQYSLSHGMIETAFAAKIAEAMSQPHTCSLGYNSLRFDDEVTRFMFYRNFIDPYAREWQQGNSRWDLIDLVRACYALRPDGIAWPQKDDGNPSFRLEDLSKANALETGKAHDALVDVRATIELAKRIKQHHPRLFDYGLSLRYKHNVQRMLDSALANALLHISPFYPASQGCCSLIMPVAVHPTNPNAVIVIDLQSDPTPLLTLSEEDLHARVFLPKSQRQTDNERLGVSLIYMNRSPFIAPAKMLDDSAAERLMIDKARCRRHFKQLTSTPGWREKLSNLYRRAPESPPAEAEQALYSGGFMTDEEKAYCRRVRLAQPEQLATIAETMPTVRLQQLLFLYRGRNFPNTFTDAELRKWQAHRQRVLQQGDYAGRRSIHAYMDLLDRCLQTYGHDEAKLSILRQLSRFVEML